MSWAFTPPARRLAGENKRQFAGTAGHGALRQLYFTVDAINSWMPTILCMLWGTAAWLSAGKLGRRGAASVMVFACESSPTC